MGSNYRSVKVLNTQNGRGERGEVRDGLPFFVFLRSAGTGTRRRLTGSAASRNPSSANTPKIGSEPGSIAPSVRIDTLVLVQSRRAEAEP